MKFWIIIFIIFLSAITFDVIKRGNANENNNVSVLKEDLIRKPNGYLLEYTKLRIDGHDYFILKEKGMFSKNSNPVHCQDCEMCLKNK